MRVSTNQLFDRNIRAIMDNQRGLSDTQNSLSTGKRLNKPSDDPVGAAKLVRLTEEMDKLTQYQRNIDLLTGSLEQQEIVLSSIEDTVNKARVLTVQAGSGGLTDTDRYAIASELKHVRDELFDLMNSKDANGNYIYSGYQSGKQAFSNNPSAAGNSISFAGDNGKNFVQVSDSARLQASSSGYDVFENVLARHNFTVNPSSTAAVLKTDITEQTTFDMFYAKNYDGATPGNNAYQLSIQAGGTVEMTQVSSGNVMGTSNFTSGEPFVLNGMEFTVNGTAGDTVDISLDPPQKKNLAETINDLYQVLSTPGLAEEDYTKARKDALAGLDNGVEKVALERSSLGGRINIASSIYETNLDLEIEAQKARSNIEDVDFAKAATELAKRETALNAAYSSFGKVANLSLFNYIK